jgi:hypothetical protein
VLVDLALPDGMFVGRRVGASAPGKVLIQSGEEGRYELTLPDIASLDSVEEFVSRLQAHVSTVYGKPVPTCPVHDHPLVCRAVGGAVSWMCPDGDWRSPIGEYDEHNWPPADLDAEGVPDAVIRRIARRDIDEVRELHPERREDGWVVHVGVWPMSDSLTDRLREAAAPIAVEVHPQPGQWYAA